MVPERIRFLERALNEPAYMLEKCFRELSHGLDYTDTLPLTEFFENKGEVAVPHIA
jgi:hypothetical protein